MLNLSHLDVLELDRESLVLQPDRAIGELRVVNVQRFDSVQDNRQMIAVGGNLVVVPLVRNELVLAVGLSRPYDRAGVIARRLRLPNLHFVAKTASEAPDKHAAIGFLAGLEIHGKHQVLIVLVRNQVSSNIAARRESPVDNLPMRS